ncbi:MAG: flagellar L-ring protein FlgH [Pseudomonadota bacterium]|nr:flagellar L-ring protein FlgH [Pseudomonadota bacterium]
MTGGWRPGPAGALASLLAVLLAGCQSVMPTVAKVDMPETPVVRPVVMPMQIVANGSIYQASQYRPLFEDHRARLIGDTITVQIVEKVSASSNSTSTVE